MCQRICVRLIFSENTIDKRVSDMPYTDILRVDGRFQSSINIQYDIGDLHKIDCYIPTDQSVQVLKEYLNAIYYGNKNEYATVLVGPYGKGKSHLMLVLLSLLAAGTLYKDEKKKRECVSSLERLITRIERIDPDTAALARETLKQKKPLLPVIVDSNATEINQVLILALRNALERCGCEDLLPEMNFDVAIKMIDRWEKEYPDAFERLKNELLPHKYSVADMKDALGTYSKSAYDIFVEIYPAVTSGSIFAPIFSEGALQLYKSVNNALIKQTEFGGMFVVYDEFSKFLEANLDKSKMMNFKVVQELAELAARSSDAELHFACITHKDLLNYNDSDSFRTVVGRFKQIEYVHSSEQAYELIANAIEKTQEYPAFLERHADTLEAARAQVFSSGLFRSMDNVVVEETILKGCFPLAPMTAFGLLRISEKVAQNERTLFTFLASHDRHTVMSFIQEEHVGMEFMTLDVVFDYFASSFATEVFNSNIHSIWAKAKAALTVAETNIQQKIIKALASIMIIGDDQIRPNAVYLKTALLISDELFMKEVDRLCELQILTKRDVAGEYFFLTPNGIDIKKSLRNYTASKLVSINVCQTLDELMGVEYVLPRQHNNKRKLLRFFRRTYMDAALFCAYDNAQEILHSQEADGVIVQVIAFSQEERERIIEHYQHMGNTDCVLLAINNEDFSLEPKLKEYIAIQTMKQGEAARADAHYAEELDIYEEDTLRFVRNKIAWDYSTTNEACKYYYHGKWIVNLTKGIQLSRFVSEICEKVYDHTPLINNEMINKTILTPPIRKARMAIVDRLLQTSEGEKLEWEGYGPEVSIYRAMISNKGIDGLHCEADAGLEAALQEIDTFVRSAVGVKQRVSSLYNRLLAAPFGIRKGIIPVYLAYVLQRIEGTITFYWENREFLATAETLENVDAEPEKYELFIDEATEDKERYIDALCDFFEVDPTASNRNSSVVAAMQRWMRGLPKIARDAKREYFLEKGELKYDAVPSDVVRMRKSLLTYDVNIRELLMEEIPQRVFEGMNYIASMDRIREIRTYLDDYTVRLKRSLVEYAKTIFAPGYKGSLAQAIGIWRGKQSERALMRLYDTPTNQMLKYTSNMDTSDETDIISRIALLMEGISIEDWNDQGAEVFCERLKKALEGVAEANAEDNRNGETGFSITISRQNESIERTVEEKEISAIGKTLMNNLRYSIDEYGEAISSDEKVAILIEMIKEVMGEA